jgi:hypothetical protein
MLEDEARHGRAVEGTPGLGPLVVQSEECVEQLFAAPVRAVRPAVLAPSHAPECTETALPPWSRAAWTVRDSALYDGTERDSALAYGRALSLLVHPSRALSLLVQGCVD